MVGEQSHQVKGTVHQEVIIPDLGLIKITPGIVISGHLGFCVDFSTKFGVFGMMVNW